MQVKRAIVSVTDRTGLSEFVGSLLQLGIEVISTKGTADYLASKGLSVNVIEFPELLSGRVKTLHQELFAGILALRDKPEQIGSVKPIDMVVVNFYNVKDPDSIDIGGPSMVRAAAKNYRYVTVVVDPSDYTSVVEKLRTNNCDTTEKLRFELARKAFQLTRRYDNLILNTIFRNDERFPEEIFQEYQKVTDLRYGENPHQKGALYKVAGHGGSSTVNAQILGEGKGLSFTNILDMDAAYELTKEFDKPTCVIVKHASPCGVATADSDDQAFKRALECDSVSAYGGILAFNTTLSKKAAHEISEFVFFEAVIAPSFQEGAVKILTERPKWGKKVRILCAGEDRRSGSSMSIRGVRDGVLIQDDDSVLSERFESVTVGVSPALEEELMFAWKVVKHVKSNAVVITKNFQTVGIGGGQVSRVDAAVMAVQKAGERAHGAVAASDALIPFKDTLKALIDAGVIAVVQPGGALRDEEVIALAMEHEIPMIFTGTRHFKH